MIKFFILIMAWANPIQVANKVYTVKGTVSFGKYGYDCSGRGICSFRPQKVESDFFNAEINRINLNEIEIKVFLSKLSDVEFFQLFEMNTDDFKEKDFNKIILQSVIPLNKETRLPLHLPDEFDEIDLDGISGFILDSCLLIKYKL